MPDQGADNSGDVMTPAVSTAAKSIADALRADLARQELVAQSIEAMDEDVAEATLKVFKPLEAARWLIEPKNKTTMYLVSIYPKNVWTLRDGEVPLELAKKGLGKAEIILLLDKIRRELLSWPRLTMTQRQGCIFNDDDRFWTKSLPVAATRGGQ